MFKKVLLGILIIAAAFLGNAGYCFDTENSIRVGISNTAFSKYIFEDAEFYSDSTISATDLSTGEEVKALGESISVKMKDGVFNVYRGGSLKMLRAAGPISIKTTKTSLIGIHDLKRAGKPAFYRGVIELVKTDKKANGFAIVNVLDLQSYLKGVVPNEMPVSFGLEALKAQCVAARNYALRPRDKFYNEFDICDSVACQVYFGAKTEKPLSSRAVEETDGLTALYNGELILALYSSTAGGYTESHAYAFSDPHSKKFPGKDIPYLQAMPDIPNMKSLMKEEDAREFYTTFPDTYDNNSPYFRWTRVWDLDEFIKMLNKTMYEQRTLIKPQFTQNDAFSQLHEVKIKQRGHSGKVMFIEITTENGKYTIGKELTIRRLFKKDGKALPSANFVCDVIKDEGSTSPKIKFTGGGFGHGVGMSQYGAGKMGKSGLNFVSILQHYYKGISIGTIPFKITSQYGKNVMSQSFYAPKNHAYIVINDISGLSEFTIVVNGVETDLGVGRILKKSRLDISKYVKKGVNTIEFIIPADYYGQNSLSAYIEVERAKQYDER